MPSFLPAVELFSQQSGLPIAVRTNSSVHDRYVFVDGATGFNSGASFKDGARLAPTTLTELTDALSAVVQIYEGLWVSGVVQR
jgi:hypothetical protein